ncbi:uncharacterized protein LOC117611894 [Osmia lignaria lignaria]|uniref:uncharacterized protein LOC117611894 n=1 Tax=Osmia lignaria lignaria TaxID=1437193 RepID=UPI001478A425|nr:uncharacterized protein LOC117611894 [Osmia lignaria]
MIVGDVNYFSPSARESSDIYPFTSTLANERRVASSDITVKNERKDNEKLAMNVKIKMDRDTRLTSTLSSRSIRNPALEFWLTKLITFDRIMGQYVTGYIFKR